MLFALVGRWQVELGHLWFLSHLLVYSLLCAAWSGRAPDPSSFFPLPVARRAAILGAGAGGGRMDKDLLSLTVQVEGGADTDAQELDELTRRLRQQLLELDVRSVQPVEAGEPPPGARAADVMVLGSLLVTLVRSPELIKTVVGVVQGWLAGQHARTVELQIGGDTLKVGGLSSAEQRRLIDLFVERHGH
ncbi:MAG TPA: hypothetical protein VGM69_20445 [Chloroflexota bacterium]